MKKVLFATTALIATAGVASADVTVGGYGFLGATFDGSTNTTTVSHKMRVTFKGSVETDSGIKFTAASRMNISDTTKDAAANALERGKITMSSGGLTLAVGATNGAMKSLARVASYQGFNDGGVVGMDSNTSTLNDSGNNIYIGYAAGDFKVAVGADIAGTTQDIAASYTVNSFTIGAGADSNNEWMIAASYDGGNWSAALGANSDNDIVLKAGYDISDATSLSFAVDAASGGTINSVGLSVSHDLGGASLVGTVGQTGGNTTVAGLGVMFSF